MVKLCTSKLNILFILLIVPFILLLGCTKSNATDQNSKITLTSTVKNVTNNVSNTFTYKIEADNSNPSVATGVPTSAQVKFENVKPDSSNIAKATVEIDFSKVTFAQAGNYKYIITETDSSDKTTFPVSSQKYEIIVMVGINGDGSQKITVIQQVINSATDKKTELNFTHEAKYTYIAIEEYVRGQMAEKDRGVYFKYKLVIDPSIGVGNSFQILGQDPTVVYNGQKISTTNVYTVKEGKENFVYVYLKHGQKITIGLTGNNINQIPIGTKYMLTKIDARKWNTFMNEEETGETHFLVAGENPEENLIVVINERDYDVAITGIFLDVLPFVILFIAAGLGVVYFVMKKKKNDNEYSD